MDIFYYMCRTHVSKRGGSGWTLDDECRYDRTAGGVSGCGMARRPEVLHDHRPAAGCRQLPLPGRSERCRQDLPPAAPQPDPGAIVRQISAVRPRRRPARPGRERAAAAPHRRRLPGFPAARPYDAPSTIWRCRCASSGASEEQISSHVSDMLAWLGLGEAIEKQPPELSMGQRQLVAVGRAVIGRPSLLLADEPTSSVDAGLRPAADASVSLAAPAGHGGGVRRPTTSGWSGATGSPCLR